MFLAILRVICYAYTGLSLLLLLAFIGLFLIRKDKPNADTRIPLP